jgi:hypothetical protein
MKLIPIIIIGLATQTMIAWAFIHSYRYFDYITDNLATVIWGTYAIGVAIGGIYAIVFRKSLFKGIMTLWTILALFLCSPFLFPVAQFIGRLMFDYIRAQNR